MLSKAYTNALRALTVVTASILLTACATMPPAKQHHCPCCESMGKQCSCCSGMENHESCCKGMGAETGMTCNPK
jgi:hypothetical protein